MAELDDNGIVQRVIVCDDPEWPAENLGGEWIAAPDPYADDDTPVVYPGPGFGCATTLPETFAPVWQQPQGAHDAWPEGAVVFHDGKLWRSTTPDNVWEPGVSGWHDAPEDGIPAWVQPTGAHDAYAKGDRVTHNGKTWESLVDANVWEPAEGSLWTEVEA